MINAIGEAAVQQSLRVNHNNVLNEKESVEQQADQVREQRPVEKTDKSPEPEMNMQQHENTSTRHRIVEGKIIFERYNEEGRLIQRIPPGYVPFGEMV